MSRQVFAVRAEHETRRDFRWVLQCAQVPGVTAESPTLEQGEAAMRKAIAWVLDVDPESFDIELAAARSRPGPGCDRPRQHQGHEHTAAR